MKSIILIGGEKDREIHMIKDEWTEINFQVMPSQESPLTIQDIPSNIEYDILRYRAADIYFDSAQVFLLDGDSQHDFLMRAATHYIGNGGK